MRAFRTSRLLWWTALGALAGAAYVAFDVLAEDKIEHGTLTGGLARLHALIDHSFPILAGALLAVCLYQLRLRARLRVAEQAAERAEALRLRLQKVERDQAVWVLAAAVLHELNNPLHVLGLLLDEQVDPDNDRARLVELAERARAQVGKALGYLSKLRALPHNVEPDLKRVELARIIAGLASDLDALDRAVALRVEGQTAVFAHADATYVRTILENLIDNSLHALRMNGGGSVNIRLAQEQGLATVSVEDDGPALSDEARAALFDPLRSTKTQGLGLGLPIARALARAMRGDLLLETGSAKRFRLELPAG